MTRETEIKIRLKDEQSLHVTLGLCKEIFGEGAYSTQRDEYFDTQDEQLKEQDLTLRLRSNQAGSLVALKSPRVFLSPKIHERIELEFKAADDSEVRQQINSQGLIATAVVEKKRWEFAGRAASVVIDTVPFIGSFVEIEGENSEIIESVMRRLNLSDQDAVSENYSELLEKKLKELNLPLRPNLRATFDMESQWFKTPEKCS